MRGRRDSVPSATGFFTIEANGDVGLWERIRGELQSEPAVDDVHVCAFRQQNFCNHLVCTKYNGFCDESDTGIIKGPGSACPIRGDFLHCIVRFHVMMDLMIWKVKRKRV